jgi:cyclopropane fatty-acyl-phospholipid synthase-like methyltransferase
LPRQSPSGIIVVAAKGKRNMGMTQDSIKSMKLYSQVERIHNELQAAGIGREGPLKVSDLSPFDQYHYHGTAAVDHAVARLKLTAESRVLEIGSGIGGPARHLAERCGCKVTALELQPDLNALAESLTQRCSLDDRVTHVCGDALKVPLEAGAYDAVVSWLALYHIADHDALFARIAAALKPGGAIFFEDLCCRGAFTAEEQDLMTKKLFSHYTPSIADYRRDLERAGFTAIGTDDMSDDWAAFTHTRYLAFQENRTRQLAVHGHATVADLEDFYGTVDRLFQNGNLAGLRVVAQKPV